MITIAIPLYNSEKYIAKSLSSVLSQTYRDIELLIIDDNCSDNSISIINEIINSNNTTIQIRIIHQDINLGVGAARNKAIKEAKGDYIYFLDSDDIITNDCINILFYKIKGTKANFIIGSNYYYNENNRNNIHSTVYEEAYIKNNLEFYRYKYSLTKHSLFTIFIWNILFDINFLKSNNLRFEEIRKGEDHIFFLEMMPHISSCIITSTITYHYIQREDSLSNYNSKRPISIMEINKSNYNYQKEVSIITKWEKNYYFPEIIFQEIRDALWVIFAIYRNRNRIKPYFSFNQIKPFLFHPLTFYQIIKLKRKRTFNIMFYIFCRMPSFFQKYIIILYVKI